jgi:hypothetical protein
MVKAAMVIQWLGGLMAFTALGFVLYGVPTRSRRKAGRFPSKVCIPKQSKAL